MNFFICKRNLQYLKKFRKSEGSHQQSGNTFIDGNCRVWSISNYEKNQWQFLLLYQSSTWQLSKRVLTWPYTNFIFSCTENLQNFNLHFILCGQHFPESMSVYCTVTTVFWERLLREEFLNTWAMWGSCQRQDGGEKGLYLRLWNDYMQVNVEYCFNYVQHWNRFSEELALGSCTEVLCVRSLAKS